MNSQDKQSNVKGKIRLFVVGCTCEYGDIDGVYDILMHFGRSCPFFTYMGEKKQYWDRTFVISIQRNHL